MRRKSRELRASKRELKSDLEVLNSARHMVCYGGRKNSLVEWTLSNDWTASELYVGGEHRGKVSTSDGVVPTSTSYGVNQCSGEIYLSD